jgi:hypothetical protein
MKLYLLKKRDGNTIPTEIGTYNAYDGFVVRAKDEASARRLAMDKEYGTHSRDWLNTDIVSCTEVSKVGNADVILASFKAG